MVTVWLRLEALSVMVRLVLHGVLVKVSGVAGDAVLEAVKPASTTLVEPGPHEQFLHCSARSNFWETTHSP